MSDKGGGSGRNKISSKSLVVPVTAAEDKKSSLTKVDLAQALQLTRSAYHEGTFHCYSMPLGH
jgi:hypothetical protein